MRQTGFGVVVRQIIRDRSDMCCERCGRLAVFGVGQIHHRRPRGAGGSKRPDTNMPSNGLWLRSGPDGCHEWIESFRSASYDQGWLVRQSAAPADVPVLRRGEWVLLRDDGSVVPHDISPINTGSDLLKLDDPAPAGNRPGIGQAVEGARRVT